LEHTAAALVQRLVKSLAFSELVVSETGQILPLASNSSLGVGVLFGAMSVAAGKLTGKAS